ncbi:hypothetical protein G3I60_37825 [Streptomyces sp. SID13666]|uniref:hypothetical protein n=1 Tax=Streptomyces sp. SID13666 TaxID=2706054 RepID=UPI0013BF841E|nr:hypothetical protein [Streptomyces sp. SID13666]NEA59768.1 hypothetical protein [Streptomyces sp. SID13666]
MLQFSDKAPEIADSSAYAETSEEKAGNDSGVTDAVRAVRSRLLDVVCAHLLDPDPTVRETALNATTAILQSLELAGRIAETTQILRRTLGQSTERRERAATILTLGAWGLGTTRSSRSPRRRVDGPAPERASRGPTAQGTVAV